MRFDIDSLAKLLGASIGDDKATDEVRAAVRALELPSASPLSMDQALAVLEHIAQTQGIVGVAARFAKSRIHLAAISEDA